MIGSATEVGDRVLTQLADLLRREQRAIDVVARYGEEFCVLLPSPAVVAPGFWPTGSSGGWPQAAGPGPSGQRDRKHRDRHLPGRPITDGTTLLQLADENMRKAKTDRKNRYRE